MKSKFILATLLAYVIGLWVYFVPLTGDEKVYISTAMEMFHSGSYGIPLLFGEPSYIKPPLVYWALIGSWKLFGFNAFGTFLPGVLALLGAALGLDRIQSRFAASASPMSAGVLFASCMGTMTYALSGQMEIWIVLFYVWFWRWALEYVQTFRARELFLALTCAGVLALVKSPIHSVFCVMGLWTYLLLTRNWQAFKRPSFYVSQLWGIGVGLSWYVYVYMADTDRFWNQYVVHETISKSHLPSASRLQMWGDLLLHATPFGVLALVSFWLLFRKRLEWKPYLIFVFAYAVWPAFFFDVFPYRTETYLFPLLPVLVLTMSMFAKELMLLKTLCKFHAFVIGMVGGALAWSLFALGWLPLTVSLLVLGAFVFLAFSFWKQNWNWILIAGLCVVFSVRMGALSIASTDLKDLREVVRQYPEREVVAYDPTRFIWHDVGMLSVALGKPIGRIYASDEVVRAVTELKIVIWGEGTDWPSSLKESASPWQRFRRRAQRLTIQDLLKIADRDSEEWKQRFTKHYFLFYQKSL